MAEPRRPAEGLIHRGVGHVEFFDLPADRAENLQPLLDAFAEEGRKTFSFHAPITRPEAFPYSGITCFYLSEDEGARELSFEVLGRTFEAARRWGAAYVVSHLTFGPTDTADPRAAQRLARRACRRMAEMSAEAGVPLDIEFAAYSDGFHEAERLVEIVADHPELGICVDIGHTYLGAVARGRNYLHDIAALAPLTRSMHLWNTTGPAHTEANHHTPLHPTQLVQDGWLDVEAALTAVLRRNPAASLVFEYPVETPTRAIQEGYDWVAGMAARLVRRWADSSN